MSRRRLADSGVAVSAATGVAIGATVWFVARAAFDRVGGPQGWTLPTVVAVSALVVVAIRALDDRLARPVLVPALLPAGLAAIYGCVPETDHIPAVAMLLVAVGVLEALGPRPAPWPVHAFVFGVVLWAGVHGATGRESALVGALFAFWPLVLLATAVVVVRSIGAVRGGTIVVAAIAATFAVSRTGALADEIDPALRSVAIASSLSAVVAAGVMVSARRARRRR